MTKIKGINLPLFKAVKFKGTDMEVLDVLFDLKVQHMNGMLFKMEQMSIPSILVLKTQDPPLIGMLMYKPPPMWWDYDDQKYQLWLSPNLPWLIHIFQEKRMKTRDPFEASALTMVIKSLEQHLKLLPQK